MIRRFEGKIMIAAWVLLALALFLLFPGRTSITGFVVYQGDLEGNTFANLTYNSTKINVSADEIKLKVITEIRSYDTEERDIINVSSAVKNGENKTTKVQNIDGKSVRVNKNKIFDVVFEDDLYNNNKIQFYILESDATEIYLCNLSQECESPGYGSVDYDGGTGFYNITISGIEDETNGFNIDPSKVEFDYIRAIYEYNVTYEYETIYYPMQAVIETDDFVYDAYAWNSIVAEETINNQTVEYYYSIDSGSTWNLAEDKDISDVSSGKIRLKIILTSNGIQTPVIKNLTVTYFEKIICNPGWQPDDNPCQFDDSKIITYTDMNECNTTEDLPADNGTYEYCDFCTPEWQETNSTCLIDDTINQYFTDLYGCYDQTGLGTDNNMPGNNTYTCDYCVPSLTGHNTTCNNGTFTTYYLDSSNCYDITGLVSDIIPVNITYDCINDSNSTPPNITNVTGQNTTTGDSLFSVVINDKETMTVVGVETTVNFTRDNISLESIEINTSTTLAPVRSINITINSSIKNNISTFNLRFYYNDTILNELNVNESTLGIYYYNEESDGLEEIISEINTTGNYVKANITHLSVYGLYGRENIEEDSGDSSNDEGSSQESSTSEPESSAAGASSRRARTTENQATMQSQEQEEQEVNEEPEQQADEPNTREISLSPSGEYEIDGTESGSVLHEVGKIINEKAGNSSNLAVVVVLIAMLAAAYVIADAKARKGYIK